MYPQHNWHSQSRGSQIGQMGLMVTVEWQSINKLPKEMVREIEQAVWLVTENALRASEPILDKIAAADEAAKP